MLVLSHVDGLLTIRDRYLQKLWLMVDKVKCQQAVDIVSTEDNAMDTAKGDIEDEACESSVIVVSNTTVHPRTMVVHLLTTPLALLAVV